MEPWIDQVLKLFEEDGQKTGSQKSVAWKLIQDTPDNEWEEEVLPQLVRYSDNQLFQVRRTKVRHDGRLLHELDLNITEIMDLGLSDVLCDRDPVNSAKCKCGLTAPPPAAERTYTEIVYNAATNGTMKWDLIYYHSPCPDGEAAAHLLWDHGKFLIPYTYGKTIMDPKEVKDKTVLFVDVCPPETILKSVYEAAKSVFVLDHHPILDMVARVLPITSYHIDTSGTRCGAVLVWTEIHKRKEEEMPYWLKIINYQDTGQFSKLTADDRAFHLAFCSTPTYRRPYDQVEGQDKKELAKVIAAGHDMIKARNERVEYAVKNRYTALLGVKEKTYQVIYAEVTEPADTAQAAHELLRLVPEAHFAAIRKPHGDYCNFSLRRRPQDTTINLQAIAQAFGGGGHQAASAIQVRPSSAMYIS